MLRWLQRNVPRNRHINHGRGQATPRCCLRHPRFCWELRPAESVRVGKGCQTSVHQCGNITPCSICCFYTWPSEQMDLHFQNYISPTIDHLFTPLEEVIRKKFLTSLTGQNAFSDNIREILAVATSEIRWPRYHQSCGQYNSTLQCIKEDYCSPHCTHHGTIQSVS